MNYEQQVLALWQADDESSSFLMSLQRQGGVLLAGGFVLALMLALTAGTFIELGTAWLIGNWRSYWILASTPVRIYRP